MSSSNSNKKKPKVDLYALLNVNSKATNEEIQKSYKALSKIFHPDRLRVRDAASAELAQETFVQIKAAHDVLVDPVFRFVYDHYGHEGVQYLRQCQVYHDGQKSNPLLQQPLLPLEPHLYSQLQKLLQSTTSASKALQLLQSAMERYQTQLQVVKERFQDAAYTFDATVELPCAHHPNAARIAQEVDNVVPYLELEQTHLQFSLRRSNRRPGVQNLPPSADGDDDDDDDDDENTSQQPQSHVPQKHIYTTTFGADTHWEATGIANAELSLGADYQHTPTSKTTWSAEVSTPITKLADGSDKRPLKLNMTSSRELTSGTVVSLALRGSHLSADSWEYIFTSYRKLAVPWWEMPRSQPGILGTNLRASCACGIRILQARPLFGFVTLTTIPPPQAKAQPHSVEDNTDKDSIASIVGPPYALSTPEVSVRAGYFPTPLLASIKYEEFGKPWTSLFASWSWSLADAGSKIKVMLSLDLWGLGFRDNDSTTIKTGLRHDFASGWIWLWEWEEVDFTVKVPIALTYTQNALWMGTTGDTTEVWHHSLGSLITSYIVLQLAKSWVADWTGRWMQGESGTEQQSTADATFSGDHHQDSFQLDDNELEGGMNRKELEATKARMMAVAEQKKRATSKTGLLIRSAILMPTKDDLTGILQFWVSGDGKLNLPALSTQSAPFHYVLGGSWEKISQQEEEMSLVSSWKHSIEQLSSKMTDHYNKTLDWIEEVTPHYLKSLRLTTNRMRKKRVPQATQAPMQLVMRYEWNSNVYEITMKEEEQVVLPHPEALLLGSASSVE